MIFYEEVLKAFQKQKAKYVIVGGFAVNLLGSMRSTAWLRQMNEFIIKSTSKRDKLIRRKLREKN